MIDMKGAEWLPSFSYRISDRFWTDGSIKKNEEVKDIYANYYCCLCACYDSLKLRFGMANSIRSTAISGRNENGNLES